MESTAVSIVQQLTGNIYPLIPGIFGSDTGSSTQPLAKNVQTLIIRADNGDPARKVNVFDNRGNKMYTIERQSGLDKCWYIFTQKDQRQVAAVTVGLINRSVDQNGLGSIKLKMSSGILGKLHRYYYDYRGTMYIWSRRSMLLQKIANPGGNNEEHRENVALARLLRPGRFDWELLIDEAKADIVTTLATAFITMKTQWLSSGLYTSATPGSLGAEAELQNPDNEYIDKPVNISPELLVYKPKPSTAGPVNFFNPPKFLEHKFTGTIANNARSDS